MIVTLLLAARWFGVGNNVHDVSTAELVVLGAGSTLAVVAHVSLQLFGAARAGIPLRPRWGWNDPEVRDIVRKTLPTVGTAMLDAVWFFALIVAAGTVAGGVVALQIGFNFYNVPLALEREGRRDRDVAAHVARLVARRSSSLPRDLRGRHLVVVVRRGARDGGPRAPRDADRAIARVRPDGTR